MTRQYPVIYEWSGKNFGGFAPDIPGCMATAKTLPKMREMLKGALESHLQWLQDDNDPIPDPTIAVTVDLENDPEFPYPPDYDVIVEKLALTMPKKKRVPTRKSSTRELNAA